MILSYQSIKRRCLKEGLIMPYCERTREFGMTYGFSAAGYDLRVAETFTLLPGQSALASTIERFSMPQDLLGKVCDKSTWARRFLSVFNTVLEPGWCGHLTLELSNHGSHVLDFQGGMPIAQVLFFNLDEPTQAPYGNSKYQNASPGVTPAILE